ncbi:MAG: PAS domain S-box protein, partial [Bacteroidales bacterium]
LFQTQEAFRATLYSIGDGVITTNLEGKVQQMNPVAEALTGWSEPEARGRVLEEIFSIIDETSRKKADSPASRVLAEGKVVGLANHTLLLSRDGREIPIDDSGAPIRDQEGKTQGVVLIFRDRAEERARQRLIEIRLQLFEGAATLSLKELFCRTLQDIASLTNSSLAFFQRYSPSGQPLERFRSDGCHSAAPVTDNCNLLRELLSWEPLVLALKQGKPLIENSYNNPLHALDQPNISRILAVPVIRNQVTVGSLLLCNKSENYTTLDQSLVSFLSDTLFETAERVRQEEVLRESEAKHRKLIEQMQLGLALHEMIVDEAGQPVDYRFLEVNRSFERITTLKGEEIVGHTVLELLPDTEKSWIERYGKVVQSGEPVAFEDYSASLGRFYNVIAYRYRSNEFAVIVEDITQRKEMEITLRESEERYRLIMDNSLDAILLTRPDGTILAANRAACGMFRMSEAEICAAGRKGIVDMTDARLPGMIRTREKEGRVQGELNFVRKGGAVFPTAVSSSLFQNSKGELFTSMTIRDLTQEKAAIAALHSSRQQYKELIDGMSETVWVIGFDGKLIEVNNMAVSTLGYSKEELLEIGLFGIDASLKEEDIRHLATTMEADKLQIFETSHKTKSGRIIPVEIYSSLVNYKGEKAILSIARDITVRKKMEEELREQGETIRLLFDSTAEGIFGIDEDGNCTFCNNAALTMLGHSNRSDIIGRNLHALIHHTHIDGSHAPQADCAVRTAFLSGKGIHLAEEWLWKKSGDPFPVELWSHPIFRDKQVIGSVVTFIDITQRIEDENVKQILYKIARTSSTTKALEDLLIVVREELSRVLETTNFYVAMLTPDKQQLRKVFFTNEKIDLEQWSVKESLSGQVILQKQSILLRGEEERIRFARKHRVTLSVTPALCWLGVPIMVEEEPRGVLVVQSYEHRDAYNKQHLMLLETIAHELAIVFQRKAMIQDLIEAKEKAEESDNLKSAFLANMSHEIRTPMNAILGFLSLLEEPDLDEANRIEYIEIVNKSGKRLLDTINDIIEISKIEACQLDLHPEPINLHEVMQYLYDLFKLQTAEKGVRYTIHPIQTPEIILTDKTKLEGILTNLIKNAIKFTTQGSIDVGCSLEGEWLNFYVKDTGRGISKEKLNAVFERFVQADIQISRPYEGSGLGLAIVKGYIDSLGGKIRVESEEDRGSTFYFSIPYLAEA